jgi:hypothetical protein
MDFSQSSWIHGRYGPVRWCPHFRTLSHAILVFSRENHALKRKRLGGSRVQGRCVYACERGRQYFKVVYKNTRSSNFVSHAGPISSVRASLRTLIFSSIVPRCGRLVSIHVTCEQEIPWRCDSHPARIVCASALFDFFVKLGAHAYHSFFWVRV